MTTYHRPGSLREALELRKQHPDYMVLAGGTDLLVAAHRKAEPPGIVDIFGLDDLCGVSEDGDGAVRIGAATTYAQILANDLANRALPCLTAACREIGALQIQARGTIGGNLGTSSPVGDSLPPLLALGADIELASTDATRTVPYDQFCTGYRQTVLRPDELIAAVRIPPPPEGNVQYWRKVGPRRAQSISKVMLAAVAALRDGTITTARVAFGAVAATPIRAAAVERAMIGARPGPALASAVRAALETEITPIDDVRSTAKYRLDVAQNLIARFVLLLA